MISSSTVFYYFQFEILCMERTDICVFTNVFNWYLGMKILSDYIHMVNNQFVNERNDIFDVMRVLDVGCGDGIKTRVLSDLLGAQKEFLDWNIQEQG